MWAKQKGFTIVELLIVIVVVAVLAAISVVAYNGIQNRSTNAKLQSQMVQIQKKIEAYNADKGNYPITQSGSLVNGSVNALVRVDSGCHIPSGTYTYRGADWVPDIDMSLPQSGGQVGTRGNKGCFFYQSDGQSYILSAWNLVVGGPQTSTMYRRIGFRETTMTDQYYLCNHANIGASNPSPYDANRDYYKFSYTLSNLSSCNETPPSGA